MTHSVDLSLWNWVWGQKKFSKTFLSFFPQECEKYFSTSAMTNSHNNNNPNNPAAVGGVRREIVNQRKKLPGGSLTSSVNSSESERGSHAGQSAVSRAATDASRRSVYLHAAAVVDIPSATERPSRWMKMKTESKITNYICTGSIYVAEINKKNVFLKESIFINYLWLAT